jgi:hypothetical protein
MVEVATELLSRAAEAALAALRYRKYSDLIQLDR